MKISIGSNFTENPYGGGNLFVKNITSYLLSKNHQVINHLKDPDIDIILLINPLRNSEQATFNNYDIDYYLNFKNNNALSIQRVNECDQRKNTTGVNKKIIKSNKFIDHTVYVSSWLRDLFLNEGIGGRKNSVIYAGANENSFNTKDKIFWDGSRKIKLVTHHWSSNPMKGWIDYKKVDEILNDLKWRNKLEFTFIGNLSKNQKFKNTKVIPPLKENDLAKELKNHDIYITGSLNEPSGNHHVEAAQCGLPILYRESGGIPEYCRNYGVSFDDDLVASLSEIISNYEIYKNEILNYPNNSSVMSSQFLRLFETLLNNKEEISKSRQKTSKFLVFIKFILFKKRKSIKIQLIQNIMKFKKYDKKTK